MIASINIGFAQLAQQLMTQLAKLGKDIFAALRFGFWVLAVSYLVSVIVVTALDAYLPSIANARKTLRDINLVLDYKQLIRLEKVSDVQARETLQDQWDQESSPPAGTLEDWPSASISRKDLCAQLSPQWPETHLKNWEEQKLAEEAVRLRLCIRQGSSFLPSREGTAWQRGDKLTPKTLGSLALFHSEAPTAEGFVDLRWNAAEKTWTGRKEVIPSLISVYPSPVPRSSLVWPVR